MSKAINKVALVLKPDDSSVVKVFEELVSLLSKNNIGISYLSSPLPEITGYDFPKITDEDIAQHCQAIIVVGGDGTFIRYAIGAAKAKVPILGINCGRVGFLTEVSSEDMAKVIPDILQGNYLSSTKTIIRNEVHHGGKNSTLLSMNDLVIQSTNGRLLEINLSVDDKFVYCERSDGIIVATSAGSSAYALSAGGPLIVPEVDALEVVNISPNTLTSRPLVLPGSSKIMIELVHGNEAAVYADGGNRINITEGDKVIVTKDDLQVPLIHHQSHDIFNAYRSKLSWHSNSNSH